MRVLHFMIIFSTLAFWSCIDDTTGGGLDGGKPAEAGLDLAQADLLWPDRGRPDAPHPDATTPDAPRPDTSAPDGPAPDTAIHDLTSAEAAPASFSATLTSAYVWANLMPPAPPDPTRAKISLTFKNSGATDITGVKLVGAAITPASGAGAIHPLKMQATTSFSGVVKAGSSVKVDFTNIPATTTTPMHFKCKDQVKVRTSVATNSGILGPLWSGTVTFTCTY